MRIWRFVNSMRPEKVHGWSVGAIHSGQNIIRLLMDSSAVVRLRSSLTAPFQARRTSASAKVLRWMAVPPPQQKFSFGRPSMLAIEAFQADASALAKPPEPNALLGIIQR